MSNQTANRMNRIKMRNDYLATVKPMMASANTGMNPNSPGFCWNARNKRKTKKRVTTIR